LTIEAEAADPNDAGCHWVLATLLAYDRSFAEADAEFAKTIELDPNEANAWAALSDITVLAGRIEEGLEHIRKAFRPNPFPASATRISQPAIGLRLSRSATLRRFSISLMDTARPVFRTDASA
jgi:Tfp pilus assembly protein PilF